MALWIAGTLLSGFSNRVTIQTAADTASKLSTAQDRTQASLTLDALQKTIDTFETRQRKGSPWYTRFGLNRDKETLRALWPFYAAASNRTLIQPIRANLEADLRQLGALTDQQFANGGEAQIKRAYDKLKAYLMLAQPQHADASFLIPELMQTSEPVRPESSQMSPGAWHDLTQRLVIFHANHLAQHGPSLAFPADASLVSTARQTLVSVVGLQNSTDTVYEQILEENRSKYPPISLQTLLGDDNTSHGLFTTKETVPGIYTRAAWDERIGRAIEKADEQRTITADWVLTTAPSTTSKGVLKEALRQRYFDDYARNWQQFLNSVRWQPDTTLSGTVDQLSLYADAQRSPLSALFKVIAFQAATGTSGESLSDTLVTKARELIKSSTKEDPSRASPPSDAPLAAAFAPLLRLAGSDKTSTPQSDLSLPRYLERVTAVRLKLQHIMASPDPDALSRAAAQAVLQGKTSDLGDSRDYAGRVAASLGEQWAGLGDALFQRPLDQTWEVVLKPASSSLNETWRASVVAAWNKSFAGRYPFADSDNDASLPEMARFLRADSGVIAQFVTTQLGGILERQGDQWVVAQGAGRNALAVDPEFVRSLNRLTRVSNVLFPNGDAGVRYELRAIPTPGVIDMRFKLSGRELHYFNQKEEWTPFIWPGDALENNAHVEWQTEQAGVRSDLDFAGRFGLIRLLERATVTQQDGARYVLKWMPGGRTSVPAARKDEPARPRIEASVPAPAKAVHIRDDWSADPSATLVSTPLALAAIETKPASSPRAPVQPIALQVQLRSESGAGPLDALKLRHFTLPSRIFLSGVAAKSVSSNPPPLPAAAIEAAKHAATPLPRNAMPEIE
ncbi:ImcF-related family protein [Caballeronia humi]|nr:ImcF-related family protein [Caballeronia humi]